VGMRPRLRRGPKAGLFKGNHAKVLPRHEPVAPAGRLTFCMKKTLLLSAVLLGAVTASQAGVRVNIGIGIPLPGLVVSQPAPVFVAPAPVVVAPAPVYVPSPPVVMAPPVVVSPPVFYYGSRPGWYGYHGWARPYGWSHRW
jgi:PXPV repeat (3 copies)